MPVDCEPLPKIPGGPTIRANFADRCASCGRPYAKGMAIHYSREHEGWILVNCCVGV